VASDATRSDELGVEVAELLDDLVPIATVEELSTDEEGVVIWGLLIDKKLLVIGPLRKLENDEVDVTGLESTVEELKLDLDVDDARWHLPYPFWHERGPKWS
jgi:hypothetical protein